MQVTSTLSTVWGPYVHCLVGLPENTLTVGCKLTVRSNEFFVLACVLERGLVNMISTFIDKAILWRQEAVRKYSNRMIQWYVRKRQLRATLNCYVLYSDQVYFEWWESRPPSDTLFYCSHKSLVHVEFCIATSWFIQIDIYSLYSVKKKFLLRHREGNSAYPSSRPIRRQRTLVPYNMKRIKYFTDILASSALDCSCRYLWCL